jgi:hypothetical protein
MAKIPVPNTDFTVFVKTENVVAPENSLDLRLGDFGDEGDLGLSKGLFSSWILLPVVMA